MKRTGFFSMFLISMAANAAAQTIDCNAVRPDIERVSNYWTERGVIRTLSSSRVEVDERKWAGLEQDYKVSIALVAFCKFHPNGTGTIIIRGSKSGDVLASVVDGNYRN